MTRPSRWFVWAALVFFGCVVLPLAAYVAGGRLAGPYAGPRGIASYLGMLYQEASRGRLLALALLAGPLACLLVWQLRAALVKRLLISPAGEDGET